MVGTVYMVAEKPSLASSIANILSDKKCSTRKGFNGACNVHEWSGSFLGANAKYKMTSVSFILEKPIDEKYFEFYYYYSRYVDMSCLLIFHPSSIIGIVLTPQNFLLV